MNITFEEYIGWTKSKRLRVIKKLAIEYLMERDQCTREVAGVRFRELSKARRRALRVQRQKELLRTFDY